ncbi:MAG: hypothetical protein ACREHD_29830 [Pirellulales bacterium]
MRDPDRPLSEGKVAAVALLKQAYEDAEDAGREARDFAVAKYELLNAGATESDLRWLLAMHYADAFAEVTPPGATKRQFRGLNEASLPESARLIVTYAGMVYAERNEIHACVRRHREMPTGSPRRPPAERIYWDGRRHELVVDGKVAKRFSRPAPLQWRVFEGWQKGGWKCPLGFAPPGDPQRDPAQRLRELIAELNRGLDRSLIHFRKDCSGNGIIYDLLS